MTLIANSLTTIFEEQITSQINRATVLLQVLPVGPGTTGKNISWNARFGSAVGGARAEGAAVVTLNNDTKVPATLEFGTYDDAFGVTGKAMAAARAAKNPEELANLFVDELGDCVERLAKGIAVDLYTGTGATDHIFGLVATGGGIMNTGTYAGIDRAVRTQWQGTVMENGGVNRALTFDLMREMRRRIYSASGLKPDLIVTTPELHEKYGKLFGQQRRYVQEIRLRGQTITLDGGYQMLEFDGIPVLEDVDCPAENMLFLNTRYVRVLQLPDQVDSVNNSMSMIGLAGTPEEQLGQPSSKLSARINPLGRDGDSYKFQLICYPQLQVRRPNSCGAIIDLDATL
ncbi:MAG TPA: phage major capsid protein [Kofleriaceae bacterium]|nr:phage major capsid protein [Kofleriaceae bacterium]